MVDMLNKCMMLFIIVTLSGCVQYKWVKQGASERTEQIDETECKAESLRALPPDNIVTGKYTSKDKKYKSTDTSYTTTDVNEEQRKTLVKACMYKKGWSQIEVQN
ncbi:hypothetical protein [Kosakonia oryziphila]|jgi:hypothetical protein